MACFQTFQYGFSTFIRGGNTHIGTQSQTTTCGWSWKRKVSKGLWKNVSFLSRIVPWNIPARHAVLAYGHLSSFWAFDVIVPTRCDGEAPIDDRPGDDLYIVGTTIRVSRSKTPDEAEHFTKNMDFIYTHRLQNKLYTLTGRAKLQAIKERGSWVEYFGELRQKTCKNVRAMETKRN